MVLPGSLGMIANILFGRPSYGRCLLESQLKEGCLQFCQHSLQHGVYQVLIQSHEQAGRAQSSVRTSWVPFMVDLVLH